MPILTTEDGVRVPVDASNYEKAKITEKSTIDAVQQIGLAAQDRGVSVGNIGGYDIFAFLFGLLLYIEVKFRSSGYMSRTDYLRAKDSFSKIIGTNSIKVLMIYGHLNNIYRVGRWCSEDNIDLVYIRSDIEEIERQGADLCLQAMYNSQQHYSLLYKLGKLYKVLYEEVVTLPILPPTSPVKPAIDTFVATPETSTILPLFPARYVSRLWTALLGFIRRSEGK